MLSEYAICEQPVSQPEQTHPPATRFLVHSHKQEYEAGNAGCDRRDNDYMKWKHKARSAINY